MFEFISDELCLAMLVRKAKRAGLKVMRPKHVRGVDGECMEPSLGYSIYTHRLIGHVVLEDFDRDAGEMLTLITRAGYHPHPVKLNWYVGVGRCYTGKPEGYTTERMVGGIINTVKL